MEAEELYDYIQENFTLDGTASRLVRNILDYVDAENFVDAEDAQMHLWSLLNGAFGLTVKEVSQYRAGEDDIPAAAPKPSLIATLKAGAAKSKAEFGMQTAPQIPIPLEV